MEIANERKIPVYKLVAYKDQLMQLYSFSACVERCNFTTFKGWAGKTYVNDDGHSVDEYKPNMRGVLVLDVHYLRLTDYVILTEEQYKDYKVISGCE